MLAHNILKHAFTPLKHHMVHLTIILNQVVLHILNLELELYEPRCWLHVCFGLMVVIRYLQENVKEQECFTVLIATEFRQLDKLIMDRFEGFYFYHVQRDSQILRHFAYFYL